MITVPLDGSLLLDNLFMAGILLIGAVVAAAGVEFPGSEGFRTWEDRLGDAPASLAPKLLRQWKRQQRWSGIGAVIGLFLAEALLWGLTPDASHAASAVYLPMLGFVGGTMLGRTAAAITAPLPRQAGTRVARASAPRLEEYVSPLERRISAVSGLVGLAVLAAFLALTLSGRFSPGVLLAGAGPELAAAAIVAWAACRWLANRVLDTPEPASSLNELVWLDAIRASVLREIMRLPFTLAAAGAVLFLVRLDASATAVAVRTGVSAPDWAVVVIGLGVFLPFLLIAGMFALAAVTAADRGERWFLKRLWPDGVPAA